MGHGFSSFSVVVRSSSGSAEPLTTVGVVAVDGPLRLRGGHCVTALAPPSIGSACDHGRARVDGVPWFAASVRVIIGQGGQLGVDVDGTEARARSHVRPAVFWGVGEPLVERAVAHPRVPSNEEGLSGGGGRSGSTAVPGAPAPESVLGAEGAAPGDSDSTSLSRVPDVWSVLAASSVSASPTLLGAVDVVRGAVVGNVGRHLALDRGGHVEILQLLLDVDSGDARLGRGACQAVERVLSACGVAIEQGLHPRAVGHLPDRGDRRPRGEQGQEHDQRPQRSRQGGQAGGLSASFSSRSRRSLIASGLPGRTGESGSSVDGSTTASGGCAPAGDWSSSLGGWARAQRHRVGSCVGRRDRRRGFGGGTDGRHRSGGADAAALAGVGAASPGDCCDDVFARSHSPKVSSTPWSCFSITSRLVTSFSRRTLQHDSRPARRVEIRAPRPPAGRRCARSRGRTRCGTP